MIQSEPVRSSRTISTPNASAITLLTLSGPVRDVEEEDEVNAHLRNCENGQGDRNAWTPDECGARDEEGRNGEQRREPKSNQVAPNALGDLCSLEALVARRGVRLMEVLCWLEVAHCAAPIKYTTVNIATQMMSRACQNRLKQSMRRRTSARYPLANTCAIIVSSQSRPTVI